MGLLDFVDTTFILTLGIILLISGGIMIYCYRRLNVLENGLIQQGRVIQDFITNYNLNGISNYAFPIILKSKSIKERDSFEKYLSKKGIEFRRGNAGGGNQLRQPYLKNFKNPVTFKNTELVHNFGYYIGNFPSLGKIKVKKIANILNSYFEYIHQFLIDNEINFEEVYRSNLSGGNIVVAVPIS